MPRTIVPAVLTRIQAGKKVRGQRQEDVDAVWEAEWRAVFLKDQRRGNGYGTLEKKSFGQSGGMSLHASVGVPSGYTGFKVTDSSASDVTRSVLQDCHVIYPVIKGPFYNRTCRSRGPGAIGRQDLNLSCHAAL
eukprot:749154-Hanusia_phi.AAC.2